MNWLRLNRTVVIIAVVGFVVWLMFHFATRNAAAIATAAAVNPTGPPIYTATLSYP
jgi:NhaP-type Na+/H+ or K+/H+ antiporter